MTGSYFSNTAVHYKGRKINIVDTPGHADFGGEVERVLKMVDGVLLLVDSFEGPMPQTRFVLQKALELKLKVLIVVNKVDRPDARCEEVVSEILDLLIDLEADESTLDNPILYVSARQGTATLDMEKPGTDLQPLFDSILNYIPAPEGDPDGPAQVLISTIDYSDYVGRIGVGRVTRGTFREGMQVVHTNLETGKTSPQWRLSGLYQFDALRRVQAREVGMGDIVAMSGMEDISIGDTVCDPACVEGLPFVKISEPTVTMTFSVNDSPFAGREGEYVTSRHLRARLMRELQTDVSLRVNETDTTDAFEVCGRGELHLSILIENMRRQGYEFAVSKPRVIFKTIDGVKCEPVERLVVDTPQASAGAVIEKIGRRRGELVHMSGADRVRLEFLVPSRGLFGYRSEFMTDIFAALGVNTENGEFVRVEPKYQDKQVQINVVSKLKEMGLPISDDYLYDTFDVEKPEDYDARKAAIEAEQEAAAERAREIARRLNEGGRGAVVEPTAEERRTFLDRFRSFFGLAPRDGANGDPLPFL